MIRDFRCPDYTAFHSLAQPSTYLSEYCCTNVMQSFDMQKEWKEFNMKEMVQVVFWNLSKEFNIYMHRVCNMGDNE